MKKETEIDLAAVEAVGSKYDNACKRLFQNREIIAPVLKEVVPEYRNSTVEEIIRYIDADSIQDIPVDDIPVSVSQLQTELGSVSDKLIRYDTHFRSINPRLSRENLCIHLHIDLLVSKKFVSFKKPMNPSKFQTHPAVLELFALCAIPAVSLKGRKNTSANNA